MKLKEMLNSFRKALAGIPGLFKALYSLPHSGKYMLLALALIFVFFILTFPYNSMIRKQVQSFEGRLYSRADIGYLDFSILGDSTAENIEIVFRNSNVFTCRKALADPSLNPFRLRKNNIKMDFELNSAKYSGKNFSSMFNLNGNIDVILNKRTGMAEDGTARFIAGNTVIEFEELKVPGPLGPMPVNIGRIKIKSINFESSIKKSVLNIDKLQVEGEDLKGTLNGTVNLKPIFPTSGINLTVKISPESKVLNEYRELIQPMIKENMLTLYITGTAGRPRIRFEKDKG